MRFEGKSIIVTGSNNGIGKATALLFAKEGASVLIHGRDLSSINETVRECKDIGLKDATFPIVQGNIEDDGIVQKIKDTALETFGKIDILVNNAGCGSAQSLGNDPMSVFDGQYKVLLRAPVYLSQLCFPELKKAKGNIVNTSSMMGINPSDSNPFYCISKAGLNMFTKCAALEFGSQGVRVNAVCPGYLLTTMHRKNGVSDEQVEEFYDLVAKTVPLGKTGTKEETAKLIAFLASDDASMMNGACVVQDGGNSLVGLDKKSLENAAK